MKGNELDRLLMAMSRSRLVLRRYREERARAVRQYVGSHYSDDAVRQKVPMPLIQMYCEIIGSKLIAQNPRVMLGTFAKQNKSAVKAMEAWVNHAIPRMKFADTMQRVVLDALFSIGIAKVALASPANSSVFGWGLKAGEPFCERVSLDDFVFDVHARDFSQVDYIGHRYRVALDVVKRSTLYSSDRKTLSPTTDPLFNREGDERLNVLGRTTIAGSDAEEFRDHVDLWEIYLPHTRRIITIADEESQGALGEGFDRRKPLRDQPWVGPPSGPYHVLSFGLVPDNPMPVGPVMHLIDLHEAANENLRKLMRQAANYKQVTFIQGGADEDGNRVLKADDGDIIRVDNPEAISQTQFRGPNADITQFMLALKELFSWTAGNLDIAGGLSPQSKTASQDEMLNQNSSSTIATKQERVINYTTDVISAMCWFWWYHPTGIMTTTTKLPGLPDAAIQRKVYPRGATQPNGLPFPNQRDANFEELDILVDPYSLQHTSPQQKLAAITQIVTQIIIPMQPLLQQQGIYFDVNAFLEHVAKYQNLPDLAEIVSIAEPPQETGEPGKSTTEMETPKPAQTKRTYERTNRSERTESGTNQAMRMGLMGQNPGGNQMQPSRNGSPG